MARPPLDWSGKLPANLAELGFSRESKLRIDGDGRLLHEGERVEHAAMARAMMGWLTRHPDDGRWVLENGWDWCYLAVDDVPWVARNARVEGEALLVSLDDGTEEPLADLHVDRDGGVRGTVKTSARGGAHPAKLSRTTQLSLVDRLVEHGGGIALALDGRVVPLLPRY